MDYFCNGEAGDKLSLVFQAQARNKMSAKVTKWLGGRKKDLRSSRNALQVGIPLAGESERRKSRGCSSGLAP